MVNHGLIIALLFIVISWIYQRRGTGRRRSCGAAATSPHPGRVFMVALLATIGLPGMNDFVGEFLILLGTSWATGGGRWWPPAGGPGRHLHAVGLPAGLPTSPTRQRPDARHRLAEGAIVAPLVSSDPLPGGVPEAGARPDHPVGRPSRPATSTSPRESSNRPSRRPVGRRAHRRWAHRRRVGLVSARGHQVAHVVGPDGDR